MFEKIILASEISPGANDMVRYMNELRKFGGKECLLLQCLTPNELKSAISRIVSDRLETILQRQKHILEEQGYLVETRVVSGLIKNEINRIAVKEDFDLIVAEAPEYSLLGEAILGGVAYEVIHKADKPVLLLRISPTDQEDKGTAKDLSLTRHILFPTDFSDNANLALECVKNMVAGGVKRVTVAHVQDKDWVDPYLLDRLEEFNEINRNNLLACQKALQDIGDVEVDIQLRYGSPYEELLKIIEEQNIPLVVMGSQGHGFIKEIYLGSLSHNVARKSSASVLLIPAKR